MVPLDGCTGHIAWSSLEVLAMPLLTLRLAAGALLLLLLALPTVLLEVSWLAAMVALALLVGCLA